MKRLTLILIFFFTSFFLFSQDITNLRGKKLLTTSDTLQLDTLSILPQSVQVQTSSGKIIDTALYQINYVKGELIWNKKKLELENIKPDSVNIVYRVFPYSFSKSFRHKDMKTYEPKTTWSPNPFLYIAGNSNNDIFKTEGLNKTGSISRGISFGNNQDVIVNSNLNLQLSGKLNNSIDILLAATDDNIPIQPDGNTQGIQEFDKVFIQLSDTKSKLVAGDFQLARPENNYFMNFNKKARGLNFSTEFKKDKTEQTGTALLKTTLSAAVSKGKFARNTIQGVERNQGPYHLKGNENELFIVVLSGTEKVYIDGEMLRRGQENDYVIDYNTAEITFTPRRIITKDKRIVVEFQYSDKNYARSLVHLGNEFSNNKMNLRFNVYSEQDSKNQPLQQQLSSEQKLLLTNAGDDLSLAVSPGFDSVAFSTNEVRYKKTDTTTASGVYKNIFIYSIEPKDAHYRINFSNLGQGHGNYQQIKSNANGKVFQWIAPINGIKQGAYEPVIQLIAPKKKQMMTLGANYNFSRQSKISVESTLSNNDINTFSNINNSDDVGSALKISLDNTRSLFANGLPDSAGSWTLFTNLNYEIIKKTFSPLERFRAVEFERDWNRASADINANQQMIGANVGLSKKNTADVNYHFNSFIEDRLYEGMKHNISSNVNQKGFLLNFDGSMLNSKSLLNSTNFFRQKAQISKKVRKIIVGVKENQEQNIFKEKNTELLQKNSYQFFEWESFVTNADTAKNKFGISYKQRTDFALGNSGLLKKSTFAENITFSMDLIKNRSHQFHSNTTYRRLSIMDSAITIQKPDNSLISRVEYNLNILKGLLSSNTFYEIGSGLEAKKEFSFIKVSAGQGVYSWMDYNGNGIEELNEFEVAAFPDKAVYIKVYVPTNNYIKTSTNQFSETVNLKPVALWANKTGFRNFMSRFADQAAYRVDRKTIGNNLLEAYNPFLRQVMDSTLVTLNSLFRNTIYFNQNNAVFGMDFGWQDVRNKLLLSNGFDSRVNTFKESHIRWNMSQKWSMNLNFRNGEKSSNSYSTTRNFRIAYYELEPRLSLQPNTLFRASLLFKYTNKENANDYGGQKSISQNYGAEIKYNVLSKGSLNMSLNYINIKYNGLSNNALAFEMLDALQPGQNITWGLSYQRTLSNNMQLNLNYDGRKSQDYKAIHTGGAQIRAFF